MTRMHSFGRKMLALALLSAVAVGGLGCATTQPEDFRRIGMVIGVKEDRLAEYKSVHADSNPGVRDLLEKANMKNFTIFMHQLDDGKYYLFGYWEYHGDDFDKDMAIIDAEQRNIEWLEMTSPMQVPLKGEKAWVNMEQVYHND